MISDEAFALLLVENSYDRWTDIYTKTGGIPKQRRGDRTRQCDSDIAPQYTHGGIKYELHQKTKTKGWTTTGIQRYNELFKMVQTDRKRYTGFMLKFIKDQKKTINNKKETTALVAVTAVHLLWDDADAQTPCETTKCGSTSGSESSDATEDSVVKI